MAQAGLVQADEYVTDPKFSITPHASVDGILPCMPLSYLLLSEISNMHHFSTLTICWACQYLFLKSAFEQILEYSDVLHQREGNEKSTIILLLITTVPLWWNRTIFYEHLKALLREVADLSHHTSSSHALAASETVYSASDAWDHFYQVPQSFHSARSRSLGCYWWWVVNYRSRLTCK